MPFPKIVTYRQLDQSNPMSSRAVYVWSAVPVGEDVVVSLAAENLDDPHDFRERTAVLRGKAQRIKGAAKARARLLGLKVTVSVRKPYEQVLIRFDER